MFEDREAADERNLGLPAEPVSAGPRPAADPAAEPQSVLSQWAAPGVDRPAPAPTPLVLPAEIVALQAAVAGLAGWEPAGLDGLVALASTGVLLDCEQALAAARTRSLSDVESRRLHHLDAAPTTGRWLSRNGHHLPAPQLTLARRLAALPRLADALAAGRVTAVVAQQLQAALTQLRPHLDRPDGLIDGQDARQALYGVVVNGVRILVCQARGGYLTTSVGTDGTDGTDGPGLVDLVRELERIYAATEGELARVEAAFLVLAAQLSGIGAAGQLGDALRQLVDALLPVQLEARARKGEAERGFSLVRNSDGSGWRAHGDLDLETGELMHVVLDAELRRDRDNPTDTDRAGLLREQGLDPYDPALQLPDSRRPRSRKERMHDALRAALRRHVAADLSGVHDKAPFHLLVAAFADTLDARPGALPAVGPTGTPLPVSLVRRWACGSALTRLVFTLAGRVIEVSHTERTLKAHERRALHAQTGGVCQVVGCNRSTRIPGAVLHPHHADPWATSGTTSLTDTVLICDTDHADLHAAHVLTLKNGRRLGPDGWVERVGPGCLPPATAPAR